MAQSRLSERRGNIQYCTSQDREVVVSRWGGGKIENQSREMRLCLERFCSNLGALSKATVRSVRTGNYIQYLVITYNGKDSETYMYIYN